MARYSLKCAAVLYAISLVLPTGSLAAPRQGTGPHACGCFCDVQYSNGKWADVASTFSLPSQYACSSAEGTTCNVSDPSSGGISTGKMVECDEASRNGMPTLTNRHPYKPPVTNPGGGLLQAVPMR
jgi:hypothetical protein